MCSIILVEDEPMQREILKIMISSIDKSIEVYEADNADSALDIIKNNHINIFLIDVGLNNSSGLDLAINIRSIPKYEFSHLVFLTTHIDYMLQAFKRIHCYDYILKPYSKNDVQAVVNKLINKEIEDLNNKKKELNENKELIVKIRSNILVRVKISDILFIEVNGNDCKVNTFKETYTYINISLKKIIELIDCEYIVQSHKAFAVNKNYILKIENLNSRLSNIYFENYSKAALLGHKFKNNIIEEFKKIGNYYVK